MDLLLLFHIQHIICYKAKIMPRDLLELIWIKPVETLVQLLLAVHDLGYIVLQILLCSLLLICQNQR